MSKKTTRRIKIFFTVVVVFILLIVGAVLFLQPFLKIYVFGFNVNSYLIES